MAAKRTTMTVSQCFNPRYNSNDPSGPEREYIYAVEKTVNTLVEPIGAWLTADRLEALMVQGIEITVLPVRK